MYFYCNCEFVLYKYIYIYVYDYTKVIFYVCILHKNWRTCEERTTVHICEWIQLKTAPVHCECTHAFAVPTPTQLECCFFRYCDKKNKQQKKVLLTSEERTDVELQVGHILAILLHNYLFPNLFAHMSQNPSNFKFQVLMRRNVTAELYIIYIYIMCLECILQKLSVHTI